ncbi:MAG: RNA polymerase subunit sigma [Gemmatimonadaceae bacterium]|nr:RNA polymerase subunit sigma [Gemmatimonadaceae bacterium]
MYDESRPDWLTPLAHVRARAASWGAGSRSRPPFFSRGRGVSQSRQPAALESVSRQDTITRLLRDVGAGDRDAFDRLVPLVYEELRLVARRQRRRWQGDDTLGTTAIIHEAYLRLADQSAPGWTSRPHFLAVAARAMRQVLLDYAKGRQAAKRGGAQRRVPIEEIDDALHARDDLGGEHAEALLAVEEALVRLERDHPPLARLVECRFHGGLTIEDTAEALGISPATVKRRWALAQAWLHRDVSQAAGDAR